MHPPAGTALRASERIDVKGLMPAVLDTCCCSCLATKHGGGRVRISLGLLPGAQGRRMGTSRTQGRFEACQGARVPGRIGVARPRVTAIKLPGGEDSEGRSGRAQGQGLPRGEGGRGLPREGIIGLRDQYRRHRERGCDHLMRQIGAGTEKQVLAMRGAWHGIRTRIRGSQSSGPAPAGARAPTGALGYRSHRGEHWWRSVPTGFLMEDV